MKPSTLSLPLLVLSTLPLAALAHESHYHSGFYMGGGLGGSQYVADFDNDINVNYGDAYGDPQSVSTPDHSQLQEYGAVGQFQVGYAYFHGAFFIAGEFGLNVNSTIYNFEQDLTVNNVGSYVDTYYVTLASNPELEFNNIEPTLDIKPGFRMTPNSLIYLRFGMAYNELELKNQINFIDNIVGPDAQYYAKSLKISDSDSGLFFRMGVGVEQKFSDKVAVSLDYIHTNYGSVTASGVTNTPAFGGDVINGFTASQSVDVKRDDVLFTVNYYF